MFKYIQSMSANKGRIQQEIFEASGRIVEHLAKLYLFPNTQYCNHWRGEVHGFLHRVSKLRNNNKLPNKKLIYTELSSYNDMCDRIMYAILKDYNDLTPTRVDADEFQTMTDDYLDWLSTELSNNGLVSFKECEDKLIDIGF